MKHLALTLTLCAALSHCGGDVVEPAVKGVGGVCLVDTDCVVGLSCEQALGRGICQPLRRDGAASLAPDASRPLGAIGAPCDTASDCLGGLACALDERGGVCAPDENGPM